MALFFIMVKGSERRKEARKEKVFLAIWKTLSATGKTVEIIYALQN